MDQQTVKLLAFTGKAQDFAIWSTGFVAMNQRKGFYKPLLGTEEQANEPAPLDNGAGNDKKKNGEDLKDAYENKIADIKKIWDNVWSHLALTPHNSTRFNNSHASETWLCGSWPHRRWFKGLEVFAREIADHGGAESGDLGGRAWSTAVRRFRGLGQLLHHRTGVVLKAKRCREKSLNGPQLSAIDVWTLCYTGKILKPGNKSCRVEEMTAEFPWEDSTETQRTKWFSGTGSKAWLQSLTQERRLLCVW